MTRTPLRIVIVISGMRHGGAEMQVIHLTRELVRRGHAVAVYCLNRGTARVGELVQSGVVVVEDQKRVKFDFGVIRRLRRFLRDFDAEIAHGFLFDGDLYSRLAAVGTGVVALNSERNDDYALNGLQKLAHWPTRGLAVAVVANSHSGAAHAGKLFGFPPQRVPVVWNCIPVAEIDARIAASTQDYRTLFFGRRDIRMACMVGTIRPQKDYLLALEVADRLTRDDPSWRVLFVGDELTRSGPYKSQVLQRHAALGLRDRAVFVGTRDDVPEIMAQSEVLFSTSFHEGFPNVVLEAMTAGAAVVSTDYSDIRRILPEPWQVVGSRSADDLVAALHRAASARAELVDRQRRWVESHATVEIGVDRLLAVYERFLAHRRGLDPVSVSAAAAAAAESGPAARRIERPK